MSLILDARKTSERERAKLGGGNWFFRVGFSWTFAEFGGLLSRAKLFLFKK